MEKKKKRTEEEIIGTKYGHLTVIRKATEEEKAGKEGSYWYTKCDCNGNEGPGYKITTISNLNRGSGLHCGCQQKKNYIILSKEEISNITRYKDITGQRFGKLTAQKIIGKDRKRGGLVWQCQCDCGNSISVLSTNLTSGRSQSCGCLKNKSTGRNIKNLQGKKFGHLTVIKINKEKNSSGPKKWLCQCDCGNPKLVSVRR